MPKTPFDKVSRELFNTVILNYFEIYILFNSKIVLLSILSLLLRYNIIFFGFLHDKKLYQNKENLKVP